MFDILFMFQILSSLGINSSICWVFGGTQFPLVRFKFFRGLILLCMFPPHNPMCGFADVSRSPTGYTALMNWVRNWQQQAILVHKELEFILLVCHTNL